MLPISASTLLQGFAGLIGVVAMVCNLPASWLNRVEKATQQYLADTDLSTLDEEKRKFKASDLWKTNGCVIMAVRRPG